MVDKVDNLKIKFNPWIIYIYVVLYLVSVQSGSVQLSIINEYGQSKMFAIILLLSLIPFPLIEMRRFKNEYTKIALALMFFIACTLVKYPGSASSLIMKSLCFLGFVGFSAYWRKRKVNIVECFCTLVFFLACIALVLFFLVSIVGSTIISFTQFDIAETIYYNWHNLFSYTPFYHVDFMGMKIYRLHGMFWEPGVYQIYLNIAIYHFLFEKKERHNTLQLIILYLNLAFSMSTTGLCIGIILLTVYVINLRMFKRSRQIMILVGGIVASIGCAYFLGQKMLASIQFGWHGSMAARIDDQFVALRLFFQNFLIGAGYDNGQLFLDTQGWGRGCTSGLLSWAYMMGIFGLVAVIYPFIKNIKHSPEKVVRRKRIVLFSMFIVFNLSEPLYWAPVNWFWVASEYVKLFYERRHLNEPKWKQNPVYWSEIF